MPVEYRFQKLKIEGFRGIKELEVDLPEGAPAHIIGSNNSGKTTILEALAFVLRSGRFPQYDVEEYDFFHPVQGDPLPKFSITLQLAASTEDRLPAIQRLGSVSFVHSLHVHGSRSKRGIMSKAFQLLDGTGDVIKGSMLPPVSAKVKAELQGHSVTGSSFQVGRYDEIREDLPEVMLLTPQNMGRSLYEWRTGPLNRLSAMLAKAFLETGWTFQFEGKPVQMPDRLKLSHAFLSHAVEEFPFWKDDVKPRLTETLSGYLGRHAQIDLKPQIQSLEEWLQQQILLSFAADEHGSPTPVECMGDGWQSLIRLAALDVLSQYPSQMRSRVVLLLEEPETHLHPHLHRKLRAVLDRLAAAGWTVVTTTHSPEMINLRGKQRIVKVRREGDELVRSVLDADQTPASLKLQAKVDERGNNELLFANKVVLTEGKDDSFAVRTALDQQTVDLDARSVSLLAVGSRDNFPDYARLLISLSVPWCVVMDQDVKADGTPKDGSLATAEALRGLKGPSDAIVVFDIDLEHCLGIPRNPDKPDNPAFKATPEWQERNVSPKTFEQVQTELPLFAAAVAKVSRWIEEGPQRSQPGGS